VANLELGSVKGHACVEPNRIEAYFSATQLHLTSRNPTKHVKGCWGLEHGNSSTSEVACDHSLQVTNIFYVSGTMFRSASAKTSYLPCQG